MDDDYAESLDDAEILEKLEESLDDYFHLLFAKYQGIMSTRARSILRNAQDTEDVVCETFIQAYRALFKMKEEGQSIRLHIHLKPWLSTIVRNSSIRCINHNGRQKRSPPDTLLNIDETKDLVEATQHDQGPSAEDEIIRREKNKELLNYIEQLPERDCQIIKLYYFSGLTDSEIANRLKIKSGTVKRARQRALKKLRKMMSKNEEE